MARRYGLRARERFPAKTRRISKHESLRYAELSGDFNPLHVDEAYGAASEFGAVVAHGNLCLQLCFDCLVDGLGLRAMPAAAQLRIRFLRPVFVGDEIAFEVMSATERPGTLVVEGECKVGGDTVAAVVARIPWPAETAD